MTNIKGISAKAEKAGIDRKTAKKYLETDKLPSEIKAERVRTYRTRKDPLEKVWKFTEGVLFSKTNLRTQELFEFVQEKYPDILNEKHLRTFQRRVKTWRCFHGPEKEVFFPQEYQPGINSAGDFTNMNSLGITINGQMFNHLFYHFTLCFSGWETGNIAFSESFESLTEGITNALKKLEGVPRYHRTDCLSAAVRNLGNKHEFQNRYKEFIKSLGMTPQRTNPGKGNENGSIEKRHDTFKNKVRQYLILRGSSDFTGIEEYQSFLEHVMDKENSKRQHNFSEDKKALNPLIQSLAINCKRIRCRVTRFSTVNILTNIYSVSSRLIKENIDAKVFSTRIEIWYANKLVEEMPRIHGKNKHRINYRHIISWLVRKPGAFHSYKYKDDLFPRTIFREVYDFLKENNPAHCDKEYLRILKAAADYSEESVVKLLEYFLLHARKFSSNQIIGLLKINDLPPVYQIELQEPDLSIYDSLLSFSLEAVS